MIHFRRRGFTLAELLIAIALIGVLAGIIMSAINPGRQYLVANDSKRLFASREIKLAVEQYIIDHHTLPASIVNREISPFFMPGISIAEPICRPGITDNLSCVNLDVLVEMNYLTALPVDVLEPASSNVTGFTIIIDEGKNVVTDSVHFGSNGQDYFASVAAWSTFTPAANGVGMDPRGYHGTAFDGRYIYFAPYANSNPFTVAHGEVLRYDTNGGFANPASWSTFDPGNAGLGSQDKGYMDVIFDGEHVYFIPFASVILPGTTPNSRVLRYDPQQEFGNLAAWSVFDLTSHFAGVRGYQGAVFDGQYLYLIPTLWDQYSLNGPFIRYDTQADFLAPASWRSFDPKQQVDPSAIGYYGGVYDGKQYVYFAPIQTSNTVFHGRVLRLDVKEPFELSTSWELFDVNAALGGNLVGYSDAVYDGRFVYFVPFQESQTGFHGRVLRYDSTLPFSAAGSWSTFNIGALSPDGVGFFRGFFDGRYVYFSPYRRVLTLEGYHGNIARFDTTKPFSEGASWSMFDPSNNGIGTDAEGYRGISFDGQYLYFSPLKNSANFHGEVLRYDTRFTQAD